MNEKSLEEWADLHGEQFHSIEPEQLNIDEKVKWHSKKKFTCKRNKGEHEYLAPTIKHQPTVRYIYKTKSGVLDSHKLENEEYLYTEVNIGLEIVCKHCGHKVLSFLSERIK